MSNLIYIILTYMKKIFILLIFLFLSSALQSQTFTRITTGDIVNDGMYSEGAYWFDYNGDGLLDLFVANIINQNNMLFVNQGNGTFTKITTGNIVTDGGFSYGGCVGDYNNDGWLDLFVANGGGSANQNNFLYMNGGFSFRKITTGNIVNDGGGSWGSATADYDKDGKLDIFVSNFNQNNFLYKGNGDSTFTKITTGSIVNDGGASITCAWGDYDNDTYPDLFVANGNFGGGQNNFLYKNNGDGTFTKITTGAIVTDGGNSVGGSWGDYDNDGDLDLFVTHYTGENNRLFRNNGNGNFTKITTGAIVNDAGSSVGSTWGDIDNDGDIDLFVANDLNENEFLYLNNGDGSFTKVTTGDIVNSAGRSNGSSFGDYDNDGDLDLYVTNGNQAPVQNNFLFRNDGNSNKWINILCKGTNSNKSAIGVRVYAKALINGVHITQMQEISGQSGYNAQNSLNVEFGLGNATQIDTLIIRWTSGLVENYYNVVANRFLTATEGQDLTNIQIYNNEIPEKFGLKQNYPNPFNPVTTVEFSIPSNVKGETSDVNLSIYDFTGKLIETLVNASLSSGTYRVNWNASGYSSGVYFYKLNAGEFTDTKKMILLK